MIQNFLIILWLIILNGTPKDLLIKKCMRYKKLMFWVKRWMNLWNYFCSHLGTVLKLGFHLCLKIVLILGISAKMLLYLSIFLPLRSSLLATILWIFATWSWHVAQAWERMKLMIRNCPTHGLNLWMIIQIFYAGLNLLLEIFQIRPREALLWKSL